MNRPPWDRVRLGDVLRSLAFYLIFYAVTVLIVIACVIAMALGSQALRRAVHGWTRFHRACVRRILGIEIRLEGQIPQEPCLFACKHESFFEAIDLPSLLRNPVVFAKASLMRIPLWGMAGRRYGLVAVERDGGATALRAMVMAARKLAAQGRPLAIFPEGTRVPHGQQVALQSGFAGLYKLINVPVVPVAVNSGQLYHRWWKRRGVITYRIGEMIPAGLARDAVEARVLAAINALNTA